MACSGCLANYIELVGLTNRCDNTTKYRRAIVRLCWPTDATRPNIALATRLLRRFSATPGERHWLCIKRVVRYLARMKNVRLKLSGKTSMEELISSSTGYVDTDFARDVVQFQSTTNFTFKIGIRAVVWHLKEKTAVLTVDGEFIVSAVPIGGLIWFWELLANMLRIKSTADHPPSILYNENAALLSVLANGNFTPHTPHIGAQYYRAQEWVVERMEGNICYCGTEEMLADSLT